MAQTVRRQTKGVTKQARAADTSRRVRKARTRTTSLFGQALALLPFTDDQLRRSFTILILAAAAVLAWVVASMSGATVLASAQIERVVAGAGFKVVHIEPQHVTRASKDAIYNIVWQDGHDVAMTHVDLEGLRAQVLTLPWVKDARISRQLPDVLIVDIIERAPHAVVRRADRLMLVDAQGVDLEPVSAEKARGLLQLAGLPDPSQGDAAERARLQAQVGHRVGALTELLSAAPALQSQVTGAEWVGNRRWNLTFRTGQQLALPEGDSRAATALIQFAQADGVHRLIGGEVASFDLRNPPRMYMRVPGRTEAQEIEVGEES